ncbi:DUF4350 domain-containing protein [Mycolicibacterium sp.]|uniref:DUF4350 domain-containing protein n=1 Tax=Mycolicibacterium sp. TaxID=2320850 RepID=UPI00355D93AE
MTAVTAGPAQRGRTWRWIAVAIVAVVLLAAVTAWLTTPRDGGRMDPTATGPDGAQALVTLLREQGVQVQVADTAAEAAALAGPDSLLLVAQTFYLWDDELLATLADAPGDLLLIAPTSRTREALAPGIAEGTESTLGGEPDCALREADRAGSARLGPTVTYEAADDDIDLTRCYEGALVRYTDGDRTITVIGTADFMTNSTLLRDGNAALAMNLAGAAPRLIWYAPQQPEGESSGAASITDLIPDRVNWIVWQLCLVVALVALWKGRRLGPLVAEKLPVVVRASETVEGRGRLYRSRRARSQAAEALRTAALQRLTPRLGLGPGTDPPTLVAAIAQNTAQRAPGLDPGLVQYALFGPPPATDDDLVHLAHALDDIERQVAHS